MDKEKAKLPKDESLIPEGSYCYNVIKQEWDEERQTPVIKTKVCPYWDYDETKHEQECGYCHFIGKGDWETNASTEKTITNMKTGEKFSPSEMLITIGLLWDQCKECGINDNFDEYEEED